MRKILLYIAVLFLAAGCQDYPFPDKQPLVGEAEVTFSVTLPEPVTVASRTAADTDVENIDVLIFDQGGTFIKRVQIDDISGADATKSFSLKLDYTPDARTFHIIANGRDGANADRVNFSILTTSISESTAMQLLRTNNVSVETDITPLIMWGRVYVSSVTQSIININNARLIRSQAALTVQTDAPAAQNGLDKFNLTSYTLHNTAGYGRVVPSNYSSSDTVPNTPTVPAGVSTVNYTTTNYWISDLSSQIYLYERQNITTDYLSLIIRGSYDGSDGYYKVALVDEHDNLVDIVRNHRYRVKIVNVDGAGYGTLQQAITSPPSNALKVTITDERDDIFIIVSDGYGELGVSVNHIELKGMPAATEMIELATIFATRDTSVTVTCSSANLTNIGYSPLANGTRKITGRWSSVSAPQTNIIVSDGPLKQVIPVRMTTMADDDISNNPSKYVYRIADVSNKPWSVGIVEGGGRARLHYELSAQTFAPGDGWGYLTIESRMYSSAYLHIMKNGTDPVVVQYSGIDDTGSLRISRIIINQ